MNNSESFIKQTAEDYDLPVGTVRDVYQNHRDKFYQKLEEILLEKRSQTP